MIASSLLWLAHVAIEIAGGGGCPDPAAVSRNLAALIPARPEADVPAAGPGLGAAPSAAPSVQLSRTSTGGLDVLLLGPDGRWLDEKRLDGASPCEDLAAAASVIIATWVSEPGLSLPSRLELPRPAAASDGREDVSSAGVPSVAGRPSPSARRVRSSAGNLRLGAVGSATTGQWAAGLRLGGGVLLWGDRWGLGAVAAATLPRSEAVGDVSGAARWTRAYVGVGPEVVLLSGPVALRAHVQGLLGLLHLAGNGVDMPTSETGVRVGAAAGAWAAWHGWGGVWPWIGADLLFWPGRDRLRIQGLSTEGRVPDLEGQIAAGLGIDLFP
ncbi:MAG TPA: hypothetical protein VIU64_02275 [Polyangia bacterium]